MSSSSPPGSPETLKEKVEKAKQISKELTAEVKETDTRIGDILQYLDDLNGELRQSLTEAKRTATSIGDTK